MRARTATLAVAAAALLGASSASADVPIEVPTRFLGGPIWSPLSPGQAPNPGLGRPSRSPSSADPCEGETPDDCVVLGADAAVDEAPFPLPGPGPEVQAPPDDPDSPDEPDVPGDPAPAPASPDPTTDLATLAWAPPPSPATQAPQEVAPAVPAVPPAAEELRSAFGGLISPGPAAWLRWQTPLLRWRPAPGAQYYNVQIFRGARRVVNAWTRAPRLRLPQDALDQGRTYVWTVWPGTGRRPEARFGAPIGRSMFGVTLRPRIVLHGRGRGLVAETRPHIPGGVIDLSGPAVRRGLAPSRLAVGPGGRFRLGIRRAAANRLSARLLTPGPHPPIGLRGHLR
jgi:hypothetical protein